MNLDDLAPARAQALLAGAQTVRLPRGASAYVVGDAPDRVYFVRSGRIKIVRGNAAGTEAIVGIRGPGEVFGELTAMTGQPRGTGAVALEPSQVAELSTAAFRTALERDPELARAFARGVAGRLAAAEHELAELLGKSVPGRLVDALGRLARDHGVREPDGSIRIAMNLTHQDLADLVGAARETLTKELGVLADVGLLRVAHKTITLVQPQAFPFARRRDAG